MHKYHEERGTISGVSPADFASDEEFEAALKTAVSGWAEADRPAALDELRRAATTPPCDGDGKPTGAPAMYEHVPQGREQRAKSREDPPAAPEDVPAG